MNSTGAATPRRVLFVDDEARVLDGLRQALAAQRDRWEMVFVTSGEAALEKLASGPFHILVSDMDMPGMDGPTLLRRARDDYPAVARLVLSTHKDRDAVLKVVPSAHQYVTKPCDPAMLTAVLERTFAVQGFLEDPQLRQLVGGIQRLPSTPHLFWELTQAVQHHGAGMDQVAGIVERDPAMAVKVLQMVNSAYFGLGRRVTSVHQAVTFLGAETVRGLVLSAQVFAAVQQGPAASQLEALQQRSLLAARLARKMCVDGHLADEAFTATLVADIGQAILIGTQPTTRLAQLHALAQQRGVPEHDVEHEVLGVTHGAVGAYLLGSWGLPLTVIEVAAFHHALAKAEARPHGVVALAHLANILAQLVQLPKDQQAPWVQLAQGAPGHDAWLPAARRELHALGLFVPPALMAAA